MIWPITRSLFSRYLSQLSVHTLGYKNASVLTHVDKAKGHLLQIHGNADDNVHHQHSIKLAKAYAEHGKDMEMFIYSNANHGMYNNNFLSEDNPADGSKTRFHLYKKMSDFFMEHLVTDDFLLLECIAIYWNFCIAIS